MKVYWCLILVGSLTFLSDSIQAQCISGNCYDGRGTFVYPSGAKYHGQFRRGKIHGQGILYFTNGNKYIGKWKNHYREGQGKLIFASGEIYTGHFRKSKFNGKGTMTFPDGEKYVGQWVNDIMEGKGTYYYADGDRYDGNFSKGKMNGFGKMTYTNGSVYEGLWKNNYKDGQGTLRESNGKRRTGLWVAGKFLGEQNPVSDVADNSNSTKPSTSQSQGSGLTNCNKAYCDDQMGVFTYADGSKWVGEFADGEPLGQGTMYYANGDKYVGGWKHHSPHGKGVMTYSNGRVYGAVWAYGKPKDKLEANDEIVRVDDIVVDRNSDVKIWAVIVGVARYTHMPTLKFTDDDAYQIYAFLKSPAGGALKDNQIKVLIDEDASRENIIKAMRKVFLKADDNDVVMLYFSGHGLPGSFLPSDFDGFNNRLRHEDIQAVFKESKAKHKLCLADACHSGTMMAMRSSYDSRLKDYYKAFEESAGGTALLLSSKGDEVSLEDHGLRQGIFSHFLIRGLKGEADKNSNKIVTVQELFDFVYNKVRTYTGNVQTPKLSGKFDPGMPIALVD